MGTKSRRPLVLFAILVVLLVVALWWNLGTGGPTAPSGGIRPNAQASPRGRPAAGAPAVVEPLALEALRAAPPEPRAAGRNPFRFGQQGAAAPETGPAAGPAVDPSSIAQVPPGPPPPPPIPLRFIGVVDETGRRLKLAVLSDGRNVFYGREGDIIEGRYRIVRIGMESIEMTHVDGRGQQTIRLSGS
jgi:hypothetical protein